MGVVCCGGSSDSTSRKTEPSQTAVQTSVSLPITQPRYHFGKKNDEDNESDEHDESMMVGVHPSDKFLAKLKGDSGRWMFTQLWKHSSHLQLPNGVILIIAQFGAAYFYFEHPRNLLYSVKVPFEISDPPVQINVPRNRDAFQKNTSPMGFVLQPSVGLESGDIYTALSFEIIEDCQTFANEETYMADLWIGLSETATQPECFCLINSQGKVCAGTAIVKRKLWRDRDKNALKKGDVITIEFVSVEKGTSPGMYSIEVRISLNHSDSKLVEWISFLPSDRVFYCVFVRAGQVRVLN